MKTLFDTLESRRLLSAVGGFNLNTGTETKAFHVVSELKVSKTGTLFVTGGSGIDVLDVTVSRGKLVDSHLAKFTLVSNSNGSGQVNAATIGVGDRPIKRVVVVGLGGDDQITVHADVPVTVRGSAGDDTIFVTAPKREVVGGSGEDKITQYTIVDAINGVTGKKGKITIRVVDSVIDPDDFSVHPPFTIHD